VTSSGSFIPDLPLAPPVLLPVQGAPPIPAGKVIGIVGNFAKHRAEMGHAGPAPPDPHFFLKATSSLLPGGGTILLPRGVGRVEHEVELAVVIGKRGKRVAPAEAMDLVLGFAVILDVTARELQAEAKKQGLPWDEAKGFDTFAPLSAPITPRAAVRDPQDVELVLRVNGQVRQRGGTAQMLAPLPQVLARLSRSMTLEPGDVIATGTPEGVGPLVAGDRVEAEAVGVGKLVCDVLEE
jgi:2-keto-4-pentenoate hydratase/2-oxohepta-3-ene-1,7-dioic acid hydratase in catechol pathway